MQTRKSLSNTARAPSHPFRRTTRTRPPAYVGRAESQQPSRGRRRAERHGERLAEGGANSRPSATQRTALGMVRLVRAWVDSTFRDRARRDPHLAILHEDLVGCENSVRATEIDSFAADDRVLAPLRGRC